MAKTQETASRKPSRAQRPAPPARGGVRGELRPRGFQLPEFLMRHADWVVTDAMLPDGGALRFSILPAVR